MRLHSHVCSKDWASSNTNEESKQQSKHQKNKSRAHTVQISDPFLSHCNQLHLFMIATYITLTSIMQTEEKEKGSRNQTMNHKRSTYSKVINRLITGSAFEASIHNKDKTTKNSDRRKKKMIAPFVLSFVMFIIEIWNGPRRSRRKLLRSENSKFFFHMIRLFFFYCGFETARVTLDHLIAEPLPRGSVQSSHGVARPKTNSQSSYLGGHSRIVHPS